MKQQGSVLVIILVVIGVLAVGGGVAYYATDGFGSNNSDNTKTANQQKKSEINSKTAKQPDESQKPKGYKALLSDAKAGKYDVKCTYSKGEDSGTFYIRGESTMRFDANTAKGVSHAIKSGDTTYVWTDGTSSGIKFTGTGPSASESEQNYSAEKYEQDAAEYNLQCVNAGHLDDSLFTPPSNIKFVNPNGFKQ